MKTNYEELKSILEESLYRFPDAVEHWHVYADVLQELGDPQGELIAIELASEAGRKDLLKERDLLRNKIVGKTNKLEVEWNHGVITEVLVSSNQSLKLLYNESIYKFSRHLRCSSFKIDVTLLLKIIPTLASLTFLDLSCNQIRDEGVKALAASPHLSSLTSLDLSCNQIRDEGVKALAVSPHLSSLT